MNQGAHIPRPARIREVVAESSNVFTWTLDPPDGFTFRPGQFNMIYAHGVGEVPISISGDPSDPTRLVHTIRAVGGVTRAMLDLRAGDVVGIRGPFGAPWPVAEAKGRDLLFVAGGLGLAPLRPAILEVLTRRDVFGRVVVTYGARTPEDFVFKSDLAAWRGRFDCDLDAICDRATRSWRGRVGVITTLVREAPIDPRATTAFVCGPEIMMRFSARELSARGVEKSDIWLSMERSMKCGVALCGHCQWGSSFVCKDGPVYRFDRVERPLFTSEL